MDLKDELDAYVAKTLREQWTIREGRQVPAPDSLQLSNDGVELDGTVLYADLADSAKLVDSQVPKFVAEVYKTFLYCVARIITSEGVRSRRMMATGSWASSSGSSRTRVPYVQR